MIFWGFIGYLLRLVDCLISFLEFLRLVVVVSGNLVDCVVLRKWCSWWTL